MVGGGHARSPLPRPLPSALSVPASPVLLPVSVMLTCKEFLELLPFLSGSNLPTGEPAGSGPTPAADCPLSLSTLAPGGMSVLVPWPPPSRWKVGFPQGRAPGPRALQSSGARGCALHEVLVAPATSPVPVILSSAIVASPCPRPLPPGPPLAPASHSPLGAVATVTDAWLRLALHPRTALGPVELAVSETGLGSRATQRWWLSR